MKAFVILATCSAVILSGCLKPPVQEKSVKIITVGRFVNVGAPTSPQGIANISPSAPLGLALDTVTGQWCRTWDWSYTTGPAAASYGDLNKLRLCKSLFDELPDNDPLGIRATHSGNEQPKPGEDPFAQFGGKVHPDLQLQPGQVAVTAPNGKTYVFPDQKSAEEFKKKAGIK